MGTATVQTKELSTGMVGGLHYGHSRYAYLGSQYKDGKSPHNGYSRCTDQGTGETEETVRGFHFPELTKQ